MKQKQIHKAASALAADPSYLYRAGQKLAEDGVFGEKRNRLILFLACITRTLALAISVIVKGSTSSGKSKLVRSVIHLVPEECVIKLAA
jgi:hypothetical protein